MSKSTKKKTNSSDIALKVEHVSKSFRLPTEKSQRYKAGVHKSHARQNWLYKAGSSKRYIV